MKNIIILAIGLILSSSLFGQTESCDGNTYNLKVEIEGFRNTNGNVLVQVITEKKEVLKSFILDLKEKKCTFTVDNLPKGKYAIRYFHDENKNQDMDTNFMGIPTEGYGFSNNAKGFFGPPDFEKQLFSVEMDKKIALKISYLL